MNDSFLQVLHTQCAMHPSLTPQDALKLSYQATFGAEHLIADPSGAQTYFLEEFHLAQSPPRQTLANGTMEPLYETISESFCRVNLRVWCAKGLPPHWLFHLFCQSASACAHSPSEPTPEDAAESFHQRLTLIKQAALAEQLPFDSAQWETACATYLQGGVRALHHSEPYRNAEHPSYRLVHTRYLPLFPLLERLATLPPTTAEGAIVLAIDGRCGAGKTTLGETLSALLHTDVIHMDDFFLPPVKRTPERLAEAGGNVDYERFASEVIPQLHQQEAFAYQRFSCAQMALADMRPIAASPMRLVEGSYSHHPVFGNYADLRVFVTIDPDTQMARIRVRNGEEQAEQFKAKWIPMEEHYFTTYDIANRADIIQSSI